jgi:hypothetical protein
VGIDLASQKRNKGLEDLYGQQRRVYADLDYLKKNKISMLRNKATTIEEYGYDVARLEKELEEIKEKTSAYQEAESDMLKYVLTFSELVKNAKLYYENALDTEKKDIAIQVFSELTFYNGSLATYKAKESFEALFNARPRTSGSEGGVRTRGQEINSLLLYR